MTLRVNPDKPGRPLEERPYATIVPDNPTRTKAEFAQHTSARTLLERYTRGGTIRRMGPGQFLNLAELPDYQRALEVVNEVRSEFEQLPARIRDRFDQDPRAFAAWIQDPELTAEEAREVLELEAPPSTPEAPTEPREEPPEAPQESPEVPAPTSDQDAS